MKTGLFALFSFLAAPWAGSMPEHERRKRFHGFRNRDRRYESAKRRSRMGQREKARLLRRHDMDVRAARLNPAWRGQGWVLRRWPELAQRP